MTARPPVHCRGSRQMPVPRYPRVPLALDLTSVNCKPAALLAAAAKLDLAPAKRPYGLLKLRCRAEAAAAPAAGSDTDIEDLFVQAGTR